MLSCERLKAGEDLIRNLTRRTQNPQIEGRKRSVGLLWVQEISSRPSKRRRRLIPLTLNRYGSTGWAISSGITSLLVAAPSQMKPQAAQLFSNSRRTSPSKPQGPVAGRVDRISPMVEGREPSCKRWAGSLLGNGLLFGPDLSSLLSGNPTVAASSLVGFSEQSVSSWMSELDRRNPNSVR